MAAGFDFEENNLLKEKRNKNLTEKNKKKMVDLESDMESDLDLLIQEKKKVKFKQKPLKEFRNSQKDFQYDYEEDPYEPLYDDAEF